MSSNKNKNTIAFYCLWAAIGAVLFTFESWIFGTRSWIYGYGSGLETIPTYLALAAEDRNLSTWSPFIAGGLDRMAFWGNANPLGIEQVLFSIFPTWLANGIHRFSQYFVTIFFTSLVLEQQFSLGKRFNLLGGWLMACFSYLTVGALFTIPGVPILIWLLHVLFKTKCRWYLAILAGAIFSLFTTFSFGVPYLLVFAFGWIVIVNQKISKHIIIQFSLFSLSLILTTIPQFLAIVTNVSLSHRSNWPAEQVNFHSLDGFLFRQLQFDMFAQDSLLSLITLNLPILAMLIGAGLAFWALSIPTLRTKAIIFLRIFILYAILSQKWLWIYLQTAIGKILPWVMGIYMGRFYQIPASFLIAISLSFSCYLIWHILLKSPLSKKIGISTLVTFIMFMIIWPKWNLLYPLGIHDFGEKNYEVKALELIKGSQKAPFRVASVLPLQPAYAYAQGLEAADGWANLFPAVYRDVWLRVLQPLMRNVPYVKQVLDPDNSKPQDNYIFLGLDLIQPGIGLLNNEDLANSLINGFDLEKRFNLNLLEMLNVKYLLSDYPLLSPDIELIHAPNKWPSCALIKNYATGLITSKNTMLCDNNMQATTSLTKIIDDYIAAQKIKSQKKDIFIYKLKNTLPRFRFISNVIVEPSPELVLDRLQTFKSQDHIQYAVLEKSDVVALNGSTLYKQGTVEVSSYRSSRIDLKVKITEPALLIIANTWNPHWRATVDGKQRALIRANHAQFSLPLFKGDQKVVFYYAPPYLNNKLTWKNYADNIN